MACKGEKPREFSQSNCELLRPDGGQRPTGQPLRPGRQEAGTRRAGKITNDAAINDLAWREPRKGWGPLETKI